MGSMKEDYQLIYFKTEIDKRSEEYWNKVKEEENKIRRWKSIGIFILGLYILYLFFEPINLGVIQSNIDRGTIIFACIVGVVLQLFFSKCIHEFAFRKAMKKVEASNYTNENDNPQGNGDKKWNFAFLMKFIFKWFFNFDHTIASYYKEKIEKQIFSESNCTCKENFRYLSRKNHKCVCCYDLVKFSNSYFIVFSNWFNVLFTVALMGILLIIIQFKGHFLMAAEFLMISQYALLAYRLVTRSLEIGRAILCGCCSSRLVKIFYFNSKFINSKTEKDMEELYLHKWKNSYIRKPTRISLAVHTLFELVLMFTMMYMLTFIVFKLDNQSVISQYITNNYMYECLLYSLSVSFFNISFINYKFLIWNILHVWQVTMSMVLIILSIAGYLGEEDDVYRRESNFYARVIK
ncbi:hypothetical protein HMPREF1014_05414 [Bacillus sp. 7_6_55CFAA_CT2]|nr:hypothetical protein HMPREF1014_05414 [Bacillus sp. 7_6_55CFAA_CT2]